MSAQTWEEVLNSPSPVASGTAYATSAALTDVSPTPQLVLPANYLKLGQTYTIEAAGVFSNTGTPTLILGAYIGGIAGAALGATGAITTITAATNWSWHLRLKFTVRSVGSTGTVFPWHGIVRMPASLTQAQAEYYIPATAPAAVTVDTTASKAVTIGAQWGTSNASNTLTVHGITIEQMN